MTPLPHDLAPYLFWLGLCGFAGAILHSEFTDRDAANEPFGDAADGDIGFISAEHLEALRGRD